jgi:hypothetical protein
MGSQFCLEPSRATPETRDYSHPRRFDLTRERPNKTVDIGVNGTSVSSDPFGGVRRSPFPYYQYGRSLR